MTEHLSLESCPTDEALVGALASTLTDIEQQQLENHFDSCDRCLTSLAALCHRLAVASDVAAAVPESVRRRAQAALGNGANTGVQLRVPSALRPSVAWRRVPVFVPVGIAVGVLLVVATLPSWNHPPGERTREIELQEQLRITATEALVRTQPNPRAEVIATLKRGANVQIGGEERDWYRVALPDGKRGWVEREAFE